MIKKIPDGLVATGIAFSLISVWQTFLFTFDVNFQAPNLEDGQNHTNYHAFRGAMLAFGVVVVLMVVVFFLKKKTQTIYHLTFFLVLCYYGGWWIPALWGLGAPHIMATLVHIIATLSTVIGLFLMKKQFNAVG